MLRPPVTERAPEPGGRTRLRRRPVAIVAHSYFDEDPRVRRQAEALVAAGTPVDVVALRRPGDAAEETVGGARVRRLDVQRHQGAGVGTYLIEYAAFFIRASLDLVRAQPRRRYALVQVATLPDPLVLAALPLRLVGVPVLLDLHEAMPVFFASRFPILGRTFLEFADAAPINPFASGYDALADKGVFGALLDLAPDFPNKELYCFNTHLQSSRQYDEVRAKQLAQIRKTIARTLRNHRAATVLCGDFNVIGERAGLQPTTEYAHALARLGHPRDLFREANPNAPGFTWDATRNPMIPKDDGDHERLDYVLAFDCVPTTDDSKPRVPIPLLFSRKVGLAMVATNLSDHFGVSATLSFRGHVPGR